MAIAEPVVCSKGNRRNESKSSDYVAAGLVTACLPERVFCAPMLCSQRKSRDLAPGIDIIDTLEVGKLHLQKTTAKDMSEEA